MIHNAQKTTILLCAVTFVWPPILSHITILSASTRIKAENTYASICYTHQFLPVAWSDLNMSFFHRSSTFSQAQQARDDALILPPTCRLNIDIANNTNEGVVHQVSPQQLPHATEMSNKSVLYGTTTHLVTRSIDITIPFSTTKPIPIHPCTLQ